MTLPLSARFDAFATALAQARQLAEAGAPLDLSGLDKAAAEMCAAAMAVPPVERPRAAKALAAIGAGLDALAAALANGGPARGDQGSRHAQAERAYRGAGQRRPGPSGPA